MQVNWRLIAAARNSYATLYAACGQAGYILNTAEEPARDVTCYSLNSLNARQYLDEIARADCITIAGGPHATACHEDLARYADYVIVGEGEHTLPRLLDELAGGRSGRIPGVATGDYYEPAHSCVRLDAYPAFSEIKGYVELSRGCPFSCGYCQTPQIFGHCMRHRSIDEAARYANRYGQARFVSPNAFAYGSDGIHPRWEKIERLLSKIKSEIYFGTFPCEVRPEFVCKEGLDLVNRYCSNTKLHFGAQSGSDAVLGRLNRGHTTSDVIHATELCREYGVTPIVDFIVGFPFETDEDQEQTAELIRWVARSGKVHVHRFIPLPGTPLAGGTARPLLKETENLCGTLALAGKLTGSWTDPEKRFQW
ncbi:TIGR04013 family B12-binding domain/radical SAM domain-containing protein [uncultured Methanoregula sp.]|uniref:TIGR04013 family B12-binding domain/radical SAM domain-containing protein n=1 Tax=uncultured Methanoregula sp. TaxID=1005933 RepID=UPI002AABAA39|nr:TIGR04013 family B12-binding domain/radical SAM domain-containing protein [uncultured Methanoregula sp.]